MPHDVLIRLVFATTCFLGAFLLFEDLKSNQKKRIPHNEFQVQAIIVLLILGLVILFPTFNLR